MSVYNFFSNIEVKKASVANYLVLYQLKIIEIIIYNIDIIKSKY